MKDVRPHTQGPEPSALRLAPRAFRVGVVDSLGRGFVGKSRKVPRNLLLKSFPNSYTGVGLELQKWLDTVPWYAVGGVELIDDLV